MLPLRAFPCSGYFLKGGVCVDVPKGVNSSAMGQSLQSLRVLPGYWRSGPASVEILRCRQSDVCVGVDAAAALAASDNETLPVAAPSDLACLPTRSGPLCELCRPPLLQVKGVCQPCLDGSVANVTTAGQYVIVGSIVLVLLHLFKNWLRTHAVKGGWRGKKKLPAQPGLTGPAPSDAAAPAPATKTDVQAVAAPPALPRPKLKTKVKIVVTFSQVPIVVVSCLCAPCVAALRVNWCEFAPPPPLPRYHALCATPTCGVCGPGAVFCDHKLRRAVPQHHQDCGRLPQHFQH